MELNELKSYLANLSKILPRHASNDDTLFSWYLSIFKDDYLVDHDVISIEALKLFEEVFPTFISRITTYGSTEADLIRFEYEAARETCAKSLKAIEDAAPNVLYLKGKNKKYIRTNSPFAPFGMVEPKAEPAYFLEALLNADTTSEMYEGVKYAVFKAYIYSFLVKEHSAFIIPFNVDYDEENPPTYRYISEENLNELRAKYPDLTKRFEDDCLQYLSSLGYYDAFAEYVVLKNAEQQKLSRLTVEQLTTVTILTFNGKSYEIDYRPKPDAG